MKNHTIKQQKMDISGKKKREKSRSCELDICQWSVLLLLKTIKPKLHTTAAKPSPADINQQG